MYIEKYWGNYIGNTDDSLTLVGYLTEKKKEEITLGEIFSDFGLDKLHDDFRKADFPLVFVSPEGWEMEIHFAINLITDLAALLLECKINKNVDLLELDETAEADIPNSMIRIIVTPKEHEQINKSLLDFVAMPLAYDLSELVPEEDMEKLAVICEELRKELYE